MFNQTEGTAEAASRFLFELAPAHLLVISRKSHRGNSRTRLAPRLLAGIPDVNSTFAQNAPECKPAVCHKLRESQKDQELAEQGEVIAAGIRRKENRLGPTHPCIGNQI